jgi:hypothetical protein
LRGLPDDERHGLMEKFATDTCKHKEVK